MRYSNNFGLNLVEGSDYVNPLVQDVPNYEKIDAVMKENRDKTIGTAYEVATGSVHAITRENKDCNFFRFVATSDYVTGDTFTVDGVTVSGLHTNGRTLTTGDYVIGASVLCCLDGSRLNFYISNSNIVEEKHFHNGVIETDNSVPQMMTFKVTGNGYVIVTASLFGMTFSTLQNVMQSLRVLTKDSEGNNVIIARVDDFNYIKDIAPDTNFTSLTSNGLNVTGVLEVKDGDVVSLYYMSNVGQSEHLVKTIKWSVLCFNCDVSYS